MNGLLRAENAAVALAALAAFHFVGASWWLFAALVLLPDLSFAGYLAGPRVGALAYNALHSWIGPALLLAVAVLSGAALWQAVALTWIFHVGADRALGYGLKHFSGFRDTHLGRIGRD